MQVNGPVRGACGESLLSCAGTLDGTSYVTLRDSVIDAALEEPRAVIVDVSALDVPATTAWSAITSAHWHVHTWPNVPLMLVCPDSAVRDALRGKGITRQVRVYRSLEEARRACVAQRRPRRQRACTRLPATVLSAARARRLVHRWLTAWSCPAMISAAATVASELVENTLLHTNSAPRLTIEYDGELVAVAVEDTSRVRAQRREDATHGTDPVSGLAVVAALSRSWGCTPRRTGKTVWAVFGPENAL